MLQVAHLTLNPKSTYSWTAFGLAFYADALCFDLFFVVDLFFDDDFSSFFFLVVLVFVVVCCFLPRVMDCALPWSGKSTINAINRNDNMADLFFILIVFWFDFAKLTISFCNNKCLRCFWTNYGDFCVKWGVRQVTSIIVRAIPSDNNLISHK